MALKEKIVDVLSKLKKINRSRMLNSASINFQDYKIFLQAFLQSIERGSLQLQELTVPGLPSFAWQ